MIYFTDRKETITNTTQFNDEYYDKKSYYRCKNTKRLYPLVDYNREDEYDDVLVEDDFRRTIDD